MEKRNFNMKTKLALFLAAAMCVSCLATGCNNANPNPTESGKNTETGSEAGSEKEPVKKVELSELYNKGKYETIDITEYVTLGDLTGLISIKESDYIVTEAEIQAEIDYYRKQLGKTEDVTDRDTVQKGDVVNIDYVGRIGGIKFEGGSDTKFDLEIGSGAFIPGFEDGLIGAKKGTTVDVVVTFPKEYPSAPELQNKEAVFSVTINSIKKIVLADYTDELVSKITNKIYTKVEDFNKLMELELKFQKKSVILTNFLEALNKKATFTDKIDSIVEEKTAETVKYYEDLAEAYKMTLEQLASSAGFDSVDKLKEALKKDIQSEVKFELLLYAYGNAINFELSNEVAVEYLDALVMLQGEASREDVLTEYGVETIRSEVYSQALVDAIINNYK